MSNISVTEQKKPESFVDDPITDIPQSRYSPDIPYDFLINHTEELIS